MRKKEIKTKIKGNLNGKQSGKLVIGRLSTYIPDILKFLKKSILKKCLKKKLFIFISVE